MRRSEKTNPAKSRRKKGPRSTFGRDDMVSNTSKKDYFVSGAMEITPHPNQLLKSALRPPIMDRRFKYTLAEFTLAGSNATSATPQNLITNSQGTTDITRTGDRVRAKRLWVSGKITGAAAATGPICSRILVVVWNPVGAAQVNAPVASQIVQHSASYGPYGSYSRDFGDSYQVLYDAIFTVSPVTASAEVELFHFDRALLIDFEFTASATIPTTNNLYMFHLCDSAANNPTVVVSSTLWYEDLDA